MTDEKIRCFIALEVSREAIDYIQELQELIKKQNLFYGKFTEPENLHLTLKFLGEIDEQKVEEVRNKLREIKFKAFDVHLDEIGFFSKNFFRIIWLKLAGKEVWDLQAEIDNRLRELFPMEERFMSHLTIARIKSVPDKKSFLDYIKNIKIKKIKFRIDEFILKKSELKIEGPVYSDIERYKLEK